MTNVEIAGYRTIFPNEVYSQEAKVAVNTTRGLELKPVDEIILLTRFNEPTEDGVIRYLQQKADSVSGAASLTLAPNALSDRSSLEKLLIALPNRVIMDLNRSDTALLEFIRRNTPVPKKDDDEPTKQYIHLVYGQIPTEIVEGNRNAGNITEAGWYKAVLDHEDLRKAGFGKQWSLKLLLDEERFPDYGEIKVLIKHGTHGSETLDISRASYPKNEVEMVLDALYQSITAFEQIRELRDVSSEALEEASIPPIIKLHQLLEMQTKIQQESSPIILPRGNP